MPQLRRSIGIEADTEPTYIAGAGAISVHPKRITHHAINGAGGGLALTIAAPTQADDGKIMTFWNEGAAAGHVITQAAVGFNGKGAAGTATFAGLATGESFQIIAHRGNWWVLALNGVAIA